MNPTIHSTTARRALASGLIAGAWLVLSASSQAAETSSPATAAAPLVQLAQAAATPVESPVSYSSEQADRGEKRYVKDCLECHGKDLKGGLNGGAPIRGVTFEQKFADGAPASGLFLYMSTLMPPNSPGRYSPHTYAELMAYILKRNGFKDGAPLPDDLDALDYLIMQK